MKTESSYITIEFDLNKLPDKTIRILDDITIKRKIDIDDLIAEILNQYAETIEE